MWILKGADLHPPESVHQIDRNRVTIYNIHTFTKKRIDLLFDKYPVQEKNFPNTGMHLEFDIQIDGNWPGHPQHKVIFQITSHKINANA